MSDWREIQSRYSSFDGTRIHSRHLIPHEATCNTALLVHGLGEHAGRYDNLYNRFIPMGLEFYAPDLRGHGLSEGGRGHIMSFSEYLKDIEVLREKIDADRPQKCGLKGGNVLIGHSMGGLIALKYALDHPDGISAVVVSGPALKIAAPVPAWKTTLGKVISNIVPSFSMPNEVNPEWLSHDPQVASRYIADSLVHDMVSARWYTEFVGAMDEVHKRAGELKMPLLVMQGGDDKLTALEGVKTFFENSGSEDKTLKVYDGMYHEIFNELQHKQVLADLEAWLKERDLI